MTIATIENAFIAWVKGKLNIEAIIAHPSAPRPTTSYAVINIFNTATLGEPEKKQTLEIDKSISVEHDELKMLSVSVNVYYSGAYQLATDLSDSLNEEDILATLRAAGLAYISKTSVDDIPEVIKKKWEDRARFDVVFSTRTEYTKGVYTTPKTPSIQKIEITNEIDGTTTVIE